ncbi:diguanylate cyclase [Undibacterium danionis]|uniref:diguanylate cyclase n=1 Tax=Undibacterium danionis TaxID=1812100 RepID=A0ABV6II86_9BURK
MPTKDEDLNEAIRALGQLFLAKLPAKFLEIETAIQRFQSTPEDRENFSLLHRSLHTMAGSAGTFGFPEMGEQARILETQLKNYVAGEVWSQSARDAFCDQVRNYLTVARQRAVETSSSIAGTSDFNAEQDISAVSMAPPVKKIVYLVDASEEVKHEITQQLEQFTFFVESFSCLQDLETALQKQIPAVLIIDTDFDSVHLAGTNEVMRLRMTGYALPPTIFISDTNSFDSRLHAVRAGGQAFLLKPVDILVLTERIEEILAHNYPRRYRIMIIDDDTELAQYYSEILKRAGMITEVLNDPELVLEQMASFRPELILMDVYMPNCDGVELSKVIRQDPSYLDIPIIFLSSENDLEKQIAAVKVGADDFLNKPIEPELWISSLSSRAERYRALRSLVMRDGLTGLYNHTAIKEDLIAKMSSASRDVTSVSVAMLDLDNFKKVNDTYGHQIGDQVLRTLSHLLRQRLRKSDVVGRYGGEEFVVIFPNTTAEVARLVLEKIRIAFNKILHVAEQAEFSVGFSAGVADSRQTTNPDDLLVIADAALYRAKHAGKNQVVLGVQ